MAPASESANPVSQVAYIVRGKLKLNMEIAAASAR